MQDALTVRAARDAEFDEIRDIYARARLFMRQTGNPDQWRDTTPTDATVREDLAAGRLLVLEDSLGIAGVFALFFEADPTYARIDGAWLSEGPYLTVHRIASAGRRGGIVAACVAYVQTLGPRMRIDTHADNRVMQQALSRAGFTRCGTIWLENGEPRIAFQRDF